MRIKAWIGLSIIAIASLIVGCGSQSNEVAASLETSEAEAYSPSLDAARHSHDLTLELPDQGTGDGTEPGDGVGPGEAGDQYDEIVENPFQRVTDHPRSTFSIDVDTASYSKVRQFLVDYNKSPRPDSVRIEELVNYFPYQYDAPGSEDSEPFATYADICQCPWNTDHRLLRIALKGREMQTSARPPSNLVLLIDTSGSMKQENKLPLLKRGMEMLLSQLNKNDRVAIVAYASAAGRVLDSTPATEKQEILDALDRLQAGGSTNGGEGLQLAYGIARDHFISGGTNRVLLCTDGDFNVGMTGTDQMLDLIERESSDGIDLTVLGFGMGNLNDSMLEQISGRGNGNYAFIDTQNEARKVLVEQLSSTLVTIAKDVKIQIEFNPLKVAAYRLIGYENRMLKTEDFNDDKKDAGEIGAGHSVTALYEIIPAGVSTAALGPETDELRYQEPAETSLAAESGELMTIKLRYKLPDSNESSLIEHVVHDSGATFEQLDSEFQFAAAVAGFGMLLRDSEHRGDWTFEDVKQIASLNLGRDEYGFRAEFVQLVGLAAALGD